MEGEIVRSEAPALARHEVERAWTRERVDLVKRTICPKGISDDGFALFMEQCKRSGLDPLLKEAFCVPRRQKVGDSWVEKHEFQPSEAGMLARAERFPDFVGIQASAVYAEDEILVDQGKGEVVHRFNPAKRKGQLVGAWARVVRAAKLPVVVWLDFSGYVQQTPLWSKIPTTMIEKCARVAALRKAYPEAFGGLYVREEMPAEEYETEAPVPRAAPESQQYQEPMEKQPPVAVVRGNGTDSAPKKRNQEKKPAALLSLEEAEKKNPAKEPVGFGQWKSTKIADLKDDELGEAWDFGESLVKDLSDPANPDHWCLNSVKSRVLLLSIEYGRREQKAGTSPKALEAP